MAIKYKDGLELWVWDSGVLEGFAVYLNRQLLDEEATMGMKYPIAKPSGDAAAIVVKFGGADGGATKIVDSKDANRVVEHQDAGTSHVTDVAPSDDQLDLRITPNIRAKVLGDTIARIGLGPRILGSDPDHPAVLASVVLTYDADALIGQAVVTPGGATR